MSHPSPQQLRITDFTYDLPAKRIATHPLPDRDASKLLVYQQTSLTESQYRHIADFLPEDALMIFNDTKVVEARLLFYKESGAKIELFCLEPGPQYPDISNALQQTGSVHWYCLIGGASKWKPGLVLEKTIDYNGTAVKLEARYIGKDNDRFEVELRWTPEALSFAEVLHAAGQIPLPPYIKRQVEVTDKDRYQTVYAREEGSVAAPTAGLHFTPEVFATLDAKGINRQFVTLHVGAGTFKPVAAAKMQDHSMHAEFIDITRSFLENLLASLGKPVIVVGTTSLRTVESLYWLGMKVYRHPDITSAALPITQWEPYEEGLPDIDTATALEHLIQWMEKQGQDRLITTTQLLIAPGYRIRVADFLVTNFHQPHSTLLLLVAAFVGDDWKRIYQNALDNEFRFLSYGDGCLLQRR